MTQAVDSLAIVSASIEELGILIPNFAEHQQPQG
jgi:hypothetical protein